MITPNGLAKTFANAARKRDMVEEVGEILTDRDEAEFLVYDKDGGALFVNIRQYKDPVR